MQKKAHRIKLKKKILILKISILVRDLRNFQHFRKNQITIILEEMILMISILIRLWETIKIKIKMILISILKTIINKEKKAKRMQFQIYLIFSEVVPFLKLIISNSQFNNKTPWTSSIMEQAHQDKLHSKTPLTKFHSKMYLALEVQIYSIKLRTIMYNRCSKHKCSSNNLINKTKKSQNLYQIQYLCHKCNLTSVNNNYFINNKQQAV